MRTELGIYHNQYIEVTAEYMRVATTGGKVNILFRNVIHEGEEITDHVWIKMQDVRNSKQINETKLKKHGINIKTKYIVGNNFFLLFMDSSGNMHDIPLAWLLPVRGHTPMSR